MQSTNAQGNSGLFILDTGADPVEDGFNAIDPGLFYVDSDDGQLYTREAIDGDDADDGSWTAQGKLLPFVGDQSAPAAPTGLTVTPVTVQHEDGGTIPGFQVSWTANSEDDLIGYTLEADAQTYNYGTESYDAATFATPLRFLFGTDETTHVIRGEFIAGIPYDFQLAARDSEGFTSAFSSVVTATSATDDSAPEIPDSVSAIAGYRLIGLTWAKNEEPDLWFYQVRFYETAAGSGAAEYIRTASSSIIIKDLTPDVEHTLDVRAVDRSGNIRVSGDPESGDEVTAKFDEDESSGYSTAVTATPTLIGASDVAFNSVLTDILSSNRIDASTISTGTLSVGGSANPGAVEVYDVTGRSIASLDEEGFVMVDPDNTSRAVWLTAGYIYFSEEYTGDVTTTTWTTGVSAEGINASAVTFGQVLGGANLIPNAGFELAPFTALTESVYTDNTDWSGATSTVNMNVSTTHLTMTST